MLEPSYWLLRNKERIEIGTQISPTNKPIGRLQNRKKRLNVKNRFICTRENFDSPSVTWAVFDFAQSFDFTAV